MSTPTSTAVDFAAPDAKFYPKIILVGPPFNGKTTLACHFPALDLVDCDNKVANAFKTIKPVGVVRRPLIDAKGLPIEEGGWAAIDAAVTAAVTNPAARTVVLDSITTVDYHLRRYCSLAQPTNINPVTVGGLKFMSQSHWNVYEVLLRGLLMKLIATPKIAIVTAHVETQRDELVGGIWQSIMLPGKSQNNVPLNFTDCWLVNGGEDKGKWLGKIRTAPGGTPRFAALGTSLDLPGEFDFSWQRIAAALSARGVV